MSWVREFIALAQSEEPFVSISVIEVLGSAPREVGARMLVTEKHETGSIGGGNLEYSAIRQARELLQQQSESARSVELFGLGVQMQQCCGGAVRVLFEKFSTQDVAKLAEEFEGLNNRRTMFLASPIEGKASPVMLNNKTNWEEAPEHLRDAANRLLHTAIPNSCIVRGEDTEWFVTRLDELPTNLVVFGAGHVGKALIKLLGDLPFTVLWCDARSDMFPTDIPANVAVNERTDLQETLISQDPGTFYIVMTHNHGLDYEICLNILKQRDFGWLGLIGSDTKRQRFEKRFIDDGIDPFTLRRLQCPIGLESIKGKHPSVIAMSTAAQLLEMRQRILEVELSDLKAVTSSIDSTAS